MSGGIVQGQPGGCTQDSHGCDSIEPLSADAYLDRQYRIGDGASHDATHR